MSGEDLRTALEQAGQVMTQPEIAQLLAQELNKAGKTMDLPDVVELSREIADVTTDRDTVMDLITQAIQGSEG